MRIDPANLSTVSEAALVLAAQARDRAAWDELVRRRQGWVRALLRRLCGDATEADDLAQDTFLRVWRRLGDLREPQAFGAWVRRITVHAYLNSRQRVSFDIDGDALSDDLAADEPGPERGAAARIDLERALARLSPPERLCVTLNLGEGLSHGEIAQMTGLPLGSVKSHILRGTIKLRRVLGDDNG